MYYPINLEPDTSGYVVTFPDIPEAITQGDNFEEAIEMAKDALESSFDFYFEDQRPVPMPSKASEGQLCVEANPRLWAKVLYLNEMLSQNLEPADLAIKLVYFDNQSNII